MQHNNSCTIKSFHGKIGKFWWGQWKWCFVFIIDWDLAVCLGVINPGWKKRILKEKKRGSSKSLGPDFVRSRNHYGLFDDAHKFIGLGWPLHDVINSLVMDLLVCMHTFKKSRRESRVWALRASRHMLKWFNRKLTTWA